MEESGAQPAVAACAAIFRPYSGCPSGSAGLRLPRLRGAPAERMTDHHSTGRLNAHIAGSLLFLALAFAGWGAFLYTLRSTNDLRAELASEVSRLQADLGQVAGERDQWRAASERQREVERELAEIRTQLQAARSEAASLRQAEEQRRAELEAARQDVASLTEQLDQANTRVQQTGTLSRPRRTTKRRGSR